MELASILRESPLFAEISEDSISRSILPRGQVRGFRRGQYLITPRQRVDRISVVLGGRLHILHLFPDGDYSLMSVLEPPEILGADLVATKSRLAPYSVMAATEGSLFSFPGDVLLRPGVLPEPERLAGLMGLLSLVARENMKKEYRLAILSRRGLRERVMTYLTMQAAKQKSDTVTIPFSREELASFLAVNRSALSHELGKLRKEGLISFRKNCFTLHQGENSVPQSKE